MKKEKSVRNAEMKAAILSTIKSLAFPVILTAIILVGVWAILTIKPPVEEKKAIRPNGYDGGDAPIEIENNALKLVLDPTTTQFTVTTKKNGHVWYSNPAEADADTIALAGSEKNKLKSTLLMAYTNINGLEVVYDNFEYCISKGLYEIESTKDMIKIMYSLSMMDREYIIPPVTTVAKYDALVAELSVGDKNFVDSYYKMYDINALGKKDNKEELLANYPILETEPVYVLRDNVKTAVRTRLENLFEGAGYTMEDYNADKELNLAEATSDKPVYNVTMTLRLDGDDLVVEVPLKDMQYDPNTPIYNVTPLPYFGAGGAEDEGYMLLPEGGGAIVRFNNGKVAQNAYQANLYGWDMALVRKAVIHNSRIYYNTFGIANGDSSYICIMEDGVSRATVKADIGGKKSTYNYVNAQYSIADREQYDVAAISDKEIYVFMPELPDEKIVQRYRFIDSNSYVDMAKAYQSYLEDTYKGYLKANNDSAAPVSIEIVGAVDKVKQVLGVPVSRPLKLTTYKEAAEMIQELQGEGMKNMSVKLSGWCNGGVNQKVLARTKLISDLGSKKDLKNLAETANQLGVNLYLDGVTQYAYDSDLLDGFFSFSDAAKFISKERAELHVYSDITFSKRNGTDPYYLLKNSVAQEMRNNLVADAKKYNTGVSFRNEGKDLSADYNRKAYVTREQTMAQHSDSFKQLADEGMKIMTNMGNDYTIAYTDMVTNMKLHGDDFSIIDEFIPFYQLAIHGKVNYTGEPVNLAPDYTSEILYAAEYGAGLQFTLMKESAFALQKTLYTEYFGSDYSAWHDRVISIYTRFNKELGHVYKQEMVGHSQIAENLKCTVYADGTKVYVNYAYEDATTPDGVTVSARDYKVVR